MDGFAFGFLVMFTVGMLLGVFRWFTRFYVY